MIPQLCYAVKCDTGVAAHGAERLANICLREMFVICSFFIHCYVSVIHLYMVKNSKLILRVGNLRF